MYSTDVYFEISFAFCCDIYIGEFEDGFCVFFCILFLLLTRIYFLQDSNGHIISTLCKNTFLLKELNAFDVSINNTASANCSSIRITCIKDWHPASRLAQTCRDPTDATISSCVTINLPEICATLHQHLLVSAQDFCSIILNDMLEILKDIDRFSVAHSFLITSAKVMHRSVVLSPNWVDVNSLFQP